MSFLELPFMYQCQLVAVGMFFAWAGFQGFRGAYAQDEQARTVGVYHWFVTLAILISLLGFGYGILTQLIPGNWPGGGAF